MSDDRKRAAFRKPPPGFDDRRKKIKHDYNLRKLTGAYTEFANYNDEIHDTIECCPVMTQIMDTKQFQRLRQIHQLGTAYLLYGNANHTRFEHSLGVAKLARDLCEHVSKQQPVVDISDKDILCVTLAGLLHDIGHGLFSHLYEVFRSDIDCEIASDKDLQTKYEQFPKVPEDWSHERSSLATIDDLLESLGLQIDMTSENLDKPLKQIGDGLDALSLRVFKGRTTHKDDIPSEENVLTNRDWIFIKECIYGKPIPEVKEKLNKDERIGRLEPEKEWLYDVVSNRHNGIDVDKVDYFARDARRTQTETNGKIKVRVLREVVVAKAKCNEPSCNRCMQGKHHHMMCYPKKCIKDICSFFQTRFDLHESAYQHKTTTASGVMLVDILKKADLHYLLRGQNGQKLPLSRAVIDPEAFNKLKDDVIVENIAQSEDESMKGAKILAGRFLRRDLYKMCGEKIVDLDNADDERLWVQAKKNPNEIAEEIFVQGKHDGIAMDMDDIVVSCCKWHCGRGDKDPLEAVRFVEKCDLGGSTIPIARKQIHEKFYYRHQKTCIRILCRDTAKQDLLAHMFKQWEMNRLENCSEQTASGGFEVMAEFRANEVSNLSGAVALTQESDCDEMMSPDRSVKSYSSFGNSPIPIPKFDLKGLSR